MEGSGRVGLVVAGLGGVGSSLIAGILAARAHLVHPFGSLAEGGGPAGGGALSPLRAQAPLLELADLELGAFELHDDDAYRAALRANLVSRSLVDELRPELRKVRAMRGARQAPTRRHLADALAEDLRGFLTHHHCARGILVCTLPGPAAPPPRTGFTADDVLSALEEGADWITPGLVYAAAAALAGFAFVAAGRDFSLCAPGIGDLFAGRGLPIAGAALLGPDALLREALANVLTAEGLQLTGTASLSTRAEEHGVRLWGGPDRTSEMGLGCGWAGAPFEVSIELRGQVALYLAARALDASLLIDLAVRAGRAGVQEWMGALFAASLANRSPREASAPLTVAGRRARLLAELPALARSAGRAAA
ncbi:MAG TPA: inositol-3-phosphate synthase [Myxococcales bacterium]|nr:inositol-3-phosphate synthase [Myxococcales bacterium]